MNNAAHLRPAGVKFQRAWLEFVPYRAPSPNEITNNSIFTGVQAVMHNRARFDDIHSAHWGFLQSYTAAYSGLVAPMENLYPDTAVTRGEFAQLLAFALQLPRASAEISGFVDVPPPNVFFDGVSRLFAAGLLGPYISGSRFNPNAIITREEMAAIIGRAIITRETELLPEDRPLNFAFTDFDEFSSQHLPNIQATVNYGVMLGFPDSSFRPQASATRVHSLEAVINLARVFGLID
jgi:hypothetical protein